MCDGDTGHRRFPLCGSIDHRPLRGHCSMEKKKREDKGKKKEKEKKREKEVVKKKVKKKVRKKVKKKIKGEET